MQIKNNKLVQHRSFINGEFVDAKDGSTFEVLNPSNGELISRVADCGAEETEAAILFASVAFQKWKTWTGIERGQVLRRWYELMMDNIDDLATILTIEQGKPWKEAKGEIRYGASFVEWFAEEAKRVYGDTVPGHQRDKRILVLKQPVGVAAAITPWNFPNAMITRKVAPALAAGCTCVIKPAEATPLSALAIAHLAEEAGFPPGVFNIVTTNRPAEVGKVLSTHPIVKKISFTGSTPVGKLLMKQSADTVKKVSLELGGNAPFIVFADADLDAAVEGAIASKYRNAGQTCVCANRLFVQEDIYDLFLQKYKAKVAALKVGDGMEKDTIIGPLINEKAVQKVKYLLEDARNKGAKTLLGGDRHELGGTFFQPTIVSDVTTSMDIHHTEIFGPVSPVYSFSDADDVIDMANDTTFGLAAYFYGKNVDLIFKVAEALEYGMVGVNTGMISTAVAPFGGIKESGFGREGSKYGMDEYLVKKYVCLQLDAK
jgi:succinate-semialdehyde dehydrogenase/glutarate-semialdehyde dehydrogenase